MRQASAVISLVLSAWVAAWGLPAASAESPKAPRNGIDEISPEKAQSGAAAADEARIFLAQLKRCEGLAGAQRESCVEIARKRLGQL